jgi:predicted phosphoribosyltransferase
MAGRRGDELVLAIPSGGVPVACEIAKAHSLSLDLLIARKVQIPGNTEAGFGAVDPDGTEIFNEPLLRQLRLSEREIREQVRSTVEVIRRRNEVFRHGRPLPELEGRSVILVDDGLASGYTMLASAGFVRRRRPRSVVVAVPTCFDRTARAVLYSTDFLACLNVRSGYSFAVAEAYEHWHDLSDEEVLRTMDEFDGQGPAP